MVEIEREVTRRFWNALDRSEPMKWRRTVAGRVPLRRWCHRRRPKSVQICPYFYTFGCPPCEAGALETLGFAESRSLGVRSQNAVSHYALPVPVLATHHHFRCQCRRMEDLELQSCPQAPQQVSTQLGVGDQYTRYRHSARSGRNQGSPRYSSSMRPPAQPS